MLFKLSDFQLRYLALLLLLLEFHLQLLKTLMHFSYLLSDLTELIFEIFINRPLGLLHSFDLLFQPAYCLMQLFNLAICLLASDFASLFFLLDQAS